VASPDHLILYDEDCGFCVRTLDRVLRWDRERRLRAVAIGSPEGQRLLSSVPPGERLDSWHLIGPEGQLSSAGGAVPKVLRLLPGGAVAAALLAAAPSVTEAGYRWIAGHRSFISRFFVLAVLIVLVGSGCGGAAQEGSELTIYVSAPLGGEDREPGEAVADGATLALEEAGGEAGGVPVRVEVLDLEPGGEGWTQAQVAADARAATEDSTSIGYVGELDSDATRVSLAITNEAGVLQVSPGPVADQLLAEPGGEGVPREFQPSGERTLVALVSESEQRPSEGEWRERGAAAMALILDAIGRAADPLSRPSVVDAALGTTERESPLGTYSVGPTGRAEFG